MNILPHIFGAFALGTWISSVQTKKKSNILVLQLLANLFYALQYFIMGFFSTGLLNLVGAFRSACFAINAKKNKENSFELLLWLLLIIYFIAVTSCNTFLSIIPVLTTILHTISTWQNNTKYLRYIFILCAVLFVFYNFMIGAYVALIGNLFEIISGMVSLIRFEKRKRS